MPLRFLIADDLGAHQRLMSNIVGFLGGEMCFAGDGHEALRLAQGGEFDVVLMDMQMPALGGAAAADRLMHHWRERSRRTRVVAVTAENTPERRALCRAIGVDGFIAKPYDASVLRDALQQTVMGGHCWTDGESRRVFDMKRFTDAADGDPLHQINFTSWCDGMARSLESVALGSDYTLVNPADVILEKWKEKSAAFGLLALEQLLADGLSADGVWLPAALADLELCKVAGAEALVAHAETVVVTA